MNTFETWWYEIGSGMPPVGTEDAEEHRKRVASAAWASATKDIETRLRDLLSVIEAHECTCFSCDRDGEKYCRCLDREVARAKAVL